jgi:hypothetical protein
VTETPGTGDDRDPTGGWQVGDPVLFRHRLGFDATFLRGTVVAVRIDDRADGAPVARFTVQIDPADGAGRLQLDLPHLNRPTPP